MKLIKEGSTGYEVSKLQSILNLKPDGIFGPMTKQMVIKFQLSKNLKPDGIVGEQTWTLLLMNKGDLIEDIDQDTDIKSQYIYTDFDQVIHKYYLDKGQYLAVNPARKNEYLFLHHTAGGSNPYNCIDYWNKDDRGRIATEFVLGGQDYITGDDTYDGVMLQAFPEGGYGWHLGKTGSGYMNQHSVGLEICSIGYLDGEYRSYVNKKAKDDQVISLTQLFRNRQHWHKYSDKQIEETAKLIKYVADRDNINVREGLQNWIKDQGPFKAFGFQEDAYYGKVKGLLSHTNVRKDKTDVYPDPRLIEVIINL